MTCFFKGLFRKIVLYDPRRILVRVLQVECSRRPIGTSSGVAGKVTASQSAAIKAADQKNHSDIHLKYRPDIDGLRALAVLGVVVFHAFPSLLRGGFIGVDVFFVISGYLITKIIDDSISERRFSITEFYARRITRIFPALLIVAVSALLFSWLFVLPGDFKLIGKHIAGGIGFIQNLILYNEVGYFDSSAKLKPLLHLWSLGVEEQFYLTLPILAVILARKLNYFILAVMVLAAISFATNIYYIHTNPAAAFYFPFSRAWELLVGSMVAIAGANFTGSKKTRHALSILGLLLIFAPMSLLNDTMMFPGWLAVFPVVGAAMLIAVGPDALVNKRILSSKPFVFIGLISYPLYLWHWPTLSFSWLIGEASRLERLGLMSMAFALAWLTYRCVELPVRRYKSKTRSSVVLAVSGIIIALLGLSAYKNEGYPERANVKEYIAFDQAIRWEYSANELCSNTFGKPEHMDSWMFCYTNTKTPEVIIIGNSFANHLYPGLANNIYMANKGVLSIGACEPSSHTDWGTPDNPTSPCASRKADLERDYIDELVAKNSSINFVILNAWWPNFDAKGDYAKRDDQVNTNIKKINIFDRPDRDQNSSFDNYFYGLSDRISTFEKLGKTVVIFGPKPELGKHIRECIDRPLKRTTENCTTIKSAEYAKQQKFREGIVALQQLHPKLKYFDQFNLFCDTSECKYLRDGKPLLRDDAHLSLYGSSYVMDHFVVWARTNMPGFVD